MQLFDLKSFSRALKLKPNLRISAKVGLIEGAKLVNTIIFICKFYKKALKIKRSFRRTDESYKKR